jgi:signal recognition particle GTPase
MPVVILTGAYGSGKTELAVNMAIQHAKVSDGRTVLVDMDITKPMFRSRDLRAELARLGIEVVSGAEGFEMADVPTISPAIYGAIEDGSAQVFIDVAGDERGARVLGRFSAVIAARGFSMLYVINANRPFCDSAQSLARSMKAIEGASRLAVTGVVANTNTGAESTSDDVVAGLKVAEEAAQAHGVRVEFASVSYDLMKEEGAGILAAVSSHGVEIRPISRYMLPPWED